MLRLEPPAPQGRTAPHRPHRTTRVSIVALPTLAQWKPPFEAFFIFIFVFFGFFFIWAGLAGATPRVALRARAQPSVVAGDESPIQVPVAMLFMWHLSSARMSTSLLGISRPPPGRRTNVASVSESGPLV